MHIATKQNCLICYTRQILNVAVKNILLDHKVILADNINLMAIFKKLKHSAKMV